jgi:cyclomaltodextrinase / maltogenic alpha-amylase / neopullulanase
MAKSTALQRLVLAIGLCGVALSACVHQGRDGGGFVHPKARSGEQKTAASTPAHAAPTAPNRNAATLITRAAGPLEARLPCNRAASPYCDLRIYQAYVGTFVDGSSAHNPVGGYGPGPHTGDIEGVIGALHHIKSLGFNAIWLTPIFDTAAGQPQLRLDGSQVVNTKLDGTGYFLRDYFKIDPQFGTLEDAQRLVNEAHSLGLKVIFDGVFGHHKGAVVASPSGRTPVDATSAVAYNGTPKTYPGRIVDFSDARSTAFYKEVARYWIDTLGIDGWRLDQVYQVPSQPLREILGEIKTASDAQLLSGYVVGEMWGSAEEIKAQLGTNANPALASAFDFPTRYALVQVLAGDENGGKGKPATTINEAWAMGAHQTYPDHAIMNFMLGNHDLVRFGDLIERAGLGGPNEETYWARHRMAFTFMAAYSGPITLYYGEELGAEVGGFAQKVTGACAGANQCDDHVGRNMVAIPGVNAPASTATPQQSALKSYLVDLMALRAQSPALSSGSRTHIYSDASLYIDLKSHGGENYLLVMNAGPTPRTMTINAPALGKTALESALVAAGRANAVVSDGQLSLSLQGLEAVLIKVTGS